LSHLTADLVAFIEHWLPPPPARVLEVGCGEGALTRHLIEARFDAIGVDPKAPPGASFRRAVIEDFESDTPFDAAVAVGSLHHVADPDRAVARLHSLLRPGARLVLFEFDVGHLDNAERSWLADHGLAGELDYDYSDVVGLAQLERALEARFVPLVREPEPYLARELGREELHEAERAAIADGLLRAVGMRLVYERA
jgi:SAM-dependent methyltransferase